MECVILAGGLGTRLSAILEDRPKCMAPIGERPFLSYLLAYLENNFCDHVILSLGYKSEFVLDWIRNQAFTFKMSWVIEKEPLGTGGGLKLALKKSKENQVFVLNGDTYFDVPLSDMKSSVYNNFEAILALKHMENFERYGTVQLNDEKLITGFQEKQKKDKGYINGGVMLLDKNKSSIEEYPDRFSLEKEFLESRFSNGGFYGHVSDSFFIDIGVPEDYKKANIILPDIWEKKYS